MLQIEEQRTAGKGRTVGALGARVGQQRNVSESSVPALGGGGSETGALGSR